MNLHNPAFKSAYNWVTYVYTLIIKFLREAFHALAAQPSCCRFEPVCSVYFNQAVKEWGILKGTSLGLFRICRCFPGSKSGVDLVPRKEVFE
jgi:putative membrane protein insertion efficiency factor